MIIYLLKGSLPWQGARNMIKGDRYKIIRDLKIETPI